MDTDPIQGCWAHRELVLEGERRGKRRSEGEGTEGETVRISTHGPLTAGTAENLPSTVSGATHCSAPSPHPVQPHSAQLRTRRLKIRGSMADDLEPNFLLDANVALASDDEGGPHSTLPINPHRSLEDEDDFALEEEWSGLNAQPSLSQDSEDPKAAKKRKKKERQKENKAKVSLLRIRKKMGLVPSFSSLSQRCIYQTLPAEKALTRRTTRNARFWQSRRPVFRSQRRFEPGKPNTS